MPDAIAKPLTWTIAECALMSGCSARVVTSWINGGHLVAFVPPGRSINDGQLGAKGLRVLRSSWDHFWAARCMTGEFKAEADPSVPIMPPRPAQGLATGTDGVRRGRRPTVV